MDTVVFDACEPLKSCQFVIDVGRVDGCADLAGEDQVILGPQVACVLAKLGHAGVLLLQSFRDHRQQGEAATARSSLGRALKLQGWPERHTSVWRTLRRWCPASCQRSPSSSPFRNPVQTPTVSRCSRPRPAAASSRRSLSSSDKPSISMGFSSFLMEMRWAALAPIQPQSTAAASA